MDHEVRVVRDPRWNEEDPDAEAMHDEPHELELQAVARVHVRHSWYDVVLGLGGGRTREECVRACATRARVCLRQPVHDIHEKVARTSCAAPSKLMVK